jgi:hypothetical protein
MVPCLGLWQNGTVKCLDCPAEMTLRDGGQGCQKLRCEPCRKAAQRATVRKCAVCRVNAAVKGLSRCETCPRKTGYVPRVPNWLEIRCLCGITFKTVNPLQRNCSSTCRIQSKSGHTRTTKQRGYGADHRRKRAELILLAIGTDCELCGGQMSADDDLDADHVVPIIQGGIDGPLRIVHRVCHRFRLAFERDAA